MLGLNEFLYFTVPLLLLALIWGSILYLKSSDVRSHRKKWRELARLSNLQYHKRDSARELRRIKGIDLPGLGTIRQAISGQLGDAWFAVLESEVRKVSVGSVLGKVVPAAFCVLVDPSLKTPEFSLRKKAGRGITDAINAIAESEVDLNSAFSQEYSLQGRAESELKARFSKATQHWFRDVNPLEIEVRHVGDVEPTTYQLELRAVNHTITLCCLDKTQKAQLSRKGGTIPARDVQQLINRAKQIRDQLLTSQSPDETT